MKLCILQASSQNPAVIQLSTCRLHPTLFVLQLRRMYLWGEYGRGRYPEPGMWHQLSTLTGLQALQART